MDETSSLWPTTGPIKEIVAHAGLAVKNKRTIMQKIRDKSPMKSRRKEGHLPSLPYPSSLSNVCVLDKEKEEKEKEGKKQRIKARLSGRISPSPTRGESAEEGIGATPERDGSGLCPFSSASCFFSFPPLHHLDKISYSLLGFLAPPTPSPIRFEGGFVKGDGLGPFISIVIPSLSPLSVLKTSKTWISLECPIPG